VIKVPFRGFRGKRGFRGDNASSRENVFIRNDFKNVSNFVIYLFTANIELNYYFIQYFFINFFPDTRVTNLQQLWR
jgi:hypothetical protein